MSKKKLKNGKLKLNKETLRKLQDAQLDAVIGGAKVTEAPTCLKSCICE